jgi:hypothetical protein
MIGKTLRPGPLCPVQGMMFVMYYITFIEARYGDMQAREKDQIP